MSGYEEAACHALGAPRFDEVEQVARRTRKSDVRSLSSNGAPIDEGAGMSISPQRSYSSLFASLLSCLVLASLAACGADDRRTPVVDSGSADAGTVDLGAAPDLGSVITDAGVDDLGTSGPVARLTGFVTRSTGPQAGGVGGLYIGVFTADPVVARDTAVQVARTVIAVADMRDAAVRVPYTIEGIPPRTAPYFVVAFLDDNGNAMATTPPGPDRGDLVTLMGFSSPSVTIATADDATFDLILSTALPF